MSGRLLIVAPHADDETLGCGGTLLKAHERGAVLAWLLVSAMTVDSGFARERIARRKGLIGRLTAAYGFASVFEAGLPATALDSLPQAELVRTLATAIEDFQPDSLYLPFPGDVHGDHRAVFAAGTGASKWFRHPHLKRILAYETLSETGFGLDPTRQDFRPNCYEDIGPWLEPKLALLEYYREELGAFPFPRSHQAVTALARLRGAESGYHAAEAFMLLRERRD